ncbi:MAG: hypothetical protein GY820_24260 [Gammaproteobacteria bacterium]|nr:hypothetical protein [Gammaproteobacteria bacterium]
MRQEEIARNLTEIQEERDDCREMIMEYRNETDAQLVSSKHPTVLPNNKEEGVFLVISVRRGCLCECPKWKNAWEGEPPK